jgi:serine acetyltransferase
VRLYQGVTLGAKSFPLDEHGNPIKGIKRHPDVEDDVIIYSEATILGPVRIGRGSVIGGNVWLVESVPAGSRITQARAERGSVRPPAPDLPTNDRGWDGPRVDSLPVAPPLNRLAPQHRPR